MPEPTPEKVRLRGGTGPEVTVPDWWSDENAPTAPQWLEWFLAQSTQAQLAVVEMHLDIERRYAQVRNAVINHD